MRSNLFVMMALMTVSFSTMAKDFKGKEISLRKDYTPHSDGGWADQDLDRGSYLSCSTYVDKKDKSKVKSFEFTIPAGSKFKIKKVESTYFKKEGYTLPTYEGLLILTLENESDKGIIVECSQTGFYHSPWTAKAHAPSVEEAFELLRRKIEPNFDYEPCDELVKRRDETDKWNCDDFSKNLKVIVPNINKLKEVCEKPQDGTFMKKSFINLIQIEKSSTQALIESCEVAYKNATNAYEERKFREYIEEGKKTLSEIKSIESEVNSKSPEYCTK